MTILADNFSPSGFDPLGLQELYRIEIIDVSTIRRLNPEQGPPLHHPVVTASVHSFSNLLEPAVQLTFNYEPLGFNQIPLLAWLEPISVLRLSAQAERLLLEQGKYTLEELKPFISSSNFIKGVGQGHFDEIRQKVHHYIHTALAQPSHLINWVSLLKIMTRSLSSLQTFVLLEQFDLAQEWELSLIDKLEIKRLSIEQKQLIIQQSQESILNSTMPSLVESLWLTISKIFIFPWIESREKIVTQEELNERYTRISLQPSLTLKMLDFLQALFPTLFLSWSPLDKELFGLNIQVQQEYSAIVTLAKNYFCRSIPAYPWQELVYLIYKECALKWEEKSIAFVEKVLTYSLLFQFYQQPNQMLMIRLSNYF
jgi:hypothetical protein